MEDQKSVGQAGEISRTIRMADAEMLDEVAQHPGIGAKRDGSYGVSIIRKIAGQFVVGNGVTNRPTLFMVLMSMVFQSTTRLMTRPSAAS